MQYKPIENYHMENEILGKEFNLGAIGSFFHAFTLKTFTIKCLSIATNFFPIFTYIISPLI
jgi:hypothetical protein